MREGSKERNALFADAIVNLLGIENSGVSGVSSNADTFAAVGFDFDCPMVAKQMLLNEPRYYAVPNVGVNRVSKNPWCEELEAPA